MTCIRGATTVQHNDAIEILTATKRLLEEMLRVNDIRTECIVSIVFTATPDLTKAYPARAARELGITQAGLLCMQEMFVENSLPKCIRVLLSVENGKAQADMRHIYQNDAVSLRPDISQRFAVAIDGPCGAGKSTVARTVARELGFTYVDTGAMYRALALYCIQTGIDLNNNAHIIQSLDDIHIMIDHQEGAQYIILNGEDVTALIRTREVADGSSKVAVIEEVRNKLVAAQREISHTNNVVMDGRDIATNVLPWAQVKIYLDANVEVRANRRYAELNEKELNTNYEKIKTEIEERDHRDIHRASSPLRQHEEAIVIDTSSMTLTQVCDRVMDICRNTRKGL